MKRGHLSAKEKEEIRTLTLQGVRQSEISRRLNIWRGTVSKVQRSFNLPTHLVIPEDEIMRLFNLGWGGYKIHRFLHIPANRVWETMHKHGFQREDRLGIATPPENIERFVAALKRREGHIQPLARKYKVGRCKANRLAHEVLQTYRFCPGASKPPLSSSFPQRHHQRVKSAG